MTPACYFIEDYLKQYLDYALEKKGPQVSTFFNSFTQILKDTEVHTVLSKVTPIGSLIAHLSNLITTSSGIRDQHLSGLFSVLKTILERFPEDRDNFQEKSQLLKFLLHECLFQTSTQAKETDNCGSEDPPKCKDPE
jgi:hypothetical protein